MASQQWQKARGMGIARSGGDANIEEFTERRWLTVNSAPAHYPY
jgi:benzaldehyde dehydrogenase (NAD)